MAGYEEFMHTSSVCEGDVILFKESVWIATPLKPIHLGYRTIQAQVIKKDPDLWVLRVHHCECHGHTNGFDQFSLIRRKASKFFAVKRKKWLVEKDRETVLNKQG